MRDGICFSNSPIGNNVVSLFTVFSHFHRKICSAKWLDKKTDLHLDQKNTGLQATSGGGAGGTAIYGLYRYVPL